MTWKGATAPEAARPWPRSKGRRQCATARTRRCAAGRTPAASLLVSTGAGSTESEIVVEQHHQEEVAEEEAEEWALGQREHHEHEGFEALPWPPVADPPSNSNSWHNGGNSSSAGPVRFYSAASGQAGGGGTAGGGAAAGGKKEADRPAWERAEVLWEAEEPQPSSGRPGGEERDPFQGGRGGVAVGITGVPCQRGVA